MSEQELAAIFIKAFDDCEIFQEVPAGGRVVDFVARMGNIVAAVEVKMSLNWDVMSQALQNTERFHYSYIAVPRPKVVHPMQERILKYFGLGLLTFHETKSSVRGYTGSHAIDEPVHPRLFRKASVPKLLDYMKYNVAGSQHGRLTPFTYFVRCMKIILADQTKPIKYTELFDKLEFKYYPRITSFKTNLYQYIRTGVIKGVEWDKGGYLSLDDEARKEVKSYDRFDRYQRELIIKPAERIN